MKRGVVYLRCMYNYSIHDNNNVTLQTQYNNAIFDIGMAIRIAVYTTNVVCCQINTVS